MLAEAQRQFDICNGCRYCEGYCAVFPAMETKVWFQEADVAYIANLCHDCRACYQACMYAPPHEYAIDIPTLLSESRTRAYRHYAWPAFMVGGFQQGPAWVAALTFLGVVLYTALVLALGATGRLVSATEGAGAFYRVVPFGFMLIPSLLVSAYVMCVLAIGGLRFLADGGVRLRALASPGTWWAVLRDASTLRYQSGGGAGCFYPEPERPSEARRWLHQAVLYGFGLDLISTALAALFQDVLGTPPPYPLLHPVVVTGTLGGIGIMVGSTGLLWLKRRSAGLADPRETALDLAFLTALDAVAVSGLVLLATRSTPFMGVALVIHLGTLVALYLTAPYGKFVHFTYRLAALVKLAVDGSHAQHV